MGLVKIYSEKKTRSNSKTSVFIGGKKIVLSWDEKCTTEIEESLLIELLKIDSSVKIFDKSIEKKISQKTPEDIDKLNERILELENENSKLKTNIEVLQKENGQLKDALGKESEKEEIEKNTEEDDPAKDLNNMKMNELRDLAKEAKLPEEEWKNFKSKKSIIEYLLDKLKHQS